MPKIEIDYSKCVIYKICCKEPSITYEYYGHTTNKTKRKQQHKATCNNENDKGYNLKVYKTIRENGGWSNWDFVVIEEYPCGNVDEARLRERYWIELKQPIMNSMLRPILTEEEKKNKYEENREEIIEYQKKRYEEKREELIEYQKNHHNDNREEYIDYQKKYYQETKDKKKKYQEENKDKIIERRDARIMCECGCEVKRGSISNHRKTEKHINKLNKLNNNIIN